MLDTPRSSGEPDSQEPRAPERRPRAARPAAALLPPAIVLALAMLGSLSIHLPMYAGLGALRELLEDAPEPPSDAIEFTVVEVGPTQPSAEPTPPEPTAAPTEVTEPEPPRREPPRRVQRPPPVRREAPPAEEPPPPPPPPAAAVAPPPPAERSIVQRSDDPDVEPPPDARFLAEENRRVEEETSVTEFRGAAVLGEQARTEDHRTGEERADELGGDEVAESDETRTGDEGGEDERAETVEDRASSRGGERGGAREQREGASAREGGTTAGEPTEIVVSDGFGTFRIRARGSRTEGTGGGAASGDRREGLGRGERGRGLAAASRGGGAGPDLDLSWADLEGVYGEEELRREREARIERRRARSRGQDRARRWQEFLAAIEEYVPGVRPGNQTALGARRSPFARFITDMHRRIHAEFADRYLAGIRPDTSSGENDMSLVTTVEISVNADGSIDRVGVVATSGNMLYDYGVFNAVMRSGPYSAPPSEILSGDGHAWVRWSMHRGPSQCGAWNARPYILDPAQFVDRGEPPRPGAPSGAGHAHDDPTHDEDPTHDDHGHDDHGHDDEEESGVDEPLPPPDETPRLMLPQAVGGEAAR